MNLETKTCQNCKQNFVIEPEDFTFYERIKVPPPTWCPECRFIRRVSFRNERTLYKRKCDLCGRNILSIYDPTNSFKTYCYSCFYSDNWDPLQWGREYDFNKSFFEQFKKLILDAPKSALQLSADVINCDYVNHVGGSKNCYLIFASLGNENCFYSTHISYSKEIMDSYRVFKSELCYECVDCNNCYNLKFSQQCQDCNDGWFLYNCRGCSNCFMSTNLVNKSYYVFNEAVSKEEYKSFISVLKTGDRKIIEEKISEFDFLKRKSIRKHLEGFNNINSRGNYIKNTKNCDFCFDLSDSENCRHVVYGNQAKDTMDAYAVYPTTELGYEIVGAGKSSYFNCFTYLPFEGANGLFYCLNAFPGW